jgi:hypothetical protein
MTFCRVASFQDMTLNNRRLKVGRGKNPGPLPPTLALSVHSGATRNVYIGNIEDFDAFNEEKLKRDFGEYGEIELVNFLKEKWDSVRLRGESYTLIVSSPGTVRSSATPTSRTKSRLSRALSLNPVI